MFLGMVGLCSRRRDVNEANLYRENGYVGGNVNKYNRIWIVGPEYSSDGTFKYPNNFA